MSVESETGAQEKRWFFSWCISQHKSCPEGGLGRKFKPQPHRAAGHGVETTVALERAGHAGLPISAIGNFRGKE